MIAKYQISEDDYLATMRLHAKITPGWLVVLIGFGVALAMLAILDPADLRAPAMGGLIGGMFAIVIMRLFVAPALSRKHYRNYKAIREQMEVELLDEGIRFTSPHGASTVLWEMVHRWRQNDTYVLIYLMPRLFYIVPKEVASQGFDVTALVQCLSANVGKPVDR